MTKKFNACVVGVCNYFTSRDIKALKDIHEIDTEMVFFLFQGGLNSISFDTMKLIYIP